jgi:hypothetical protein
MKKKKAPNEARSMIMTTGTTIAGMRVLVFVLDDLWVLAAELVAAAALAVPLVVAAVVAVGDASVLNAPAADREVNSAEFETTTGTP